MEVPFDHTQSYVEGSPEAIFAEACRKAEAALIHAKCQFGIEPSYCGFAWVRIKPARGKFVSMLKERHIGDYGAYGGWELLPLDFTRIYNGQSIDFKEAICSGAAESLRQNGINAWMQSRAD